MALDGLRWVFGANGAPDEQAAGLLDAVRMQAVLQSQRGAIEDMNALCDALFTQN